MASTVISGYTRFKDPNGLISDHENKRTTGNGLMYTGEYAYALHKFMGSQQPKAVAYLNERNNVVMAVRACEKRPGLYMRTPNGGYFNAPDDYFGLGMVAKFLDPRIAEDILHYGRANNFMYNDQEPTQWRWKSWLGRMPQLIAHLQFAAGEKPNLWRLTVWVISLGLSLFKPRKSQDSFVKTWMMCKVAYGSNKYLDLIIRLYRIWYKRRYPGGIGQVRKEHGWRRGGPEGRTIDHPTVQYLWTDV